MVCHVDGSRGGDGLGAVGYDISLAWSKDAFDEPKWCHVLSASFFIGETKSATEAELIAIREALWCCVALARTGNPCWNGRSRAAPPGRGLLDSSLKFYR
jgi:hypothetical protein